MADHVIWQDPPAPTRGASGKYVKFFQTLRENPGKWALMGEFSASAAAASVKAGTYAGAKKGEFDAVSRVVHKNGGKKVYAIYVRYPEKEAK